MDKLIDFLDKLDDKEIYYRLNRVSDSILVEVAVPGQRWKLSLIEMDMSRSKDLSAKASLWTKQVLKDFFGNSVIRHTIKEQKPMEIGVLIC